MMIVDSYLILCSYLDAPEELSVGNGAYCIGMSKSSSATVSTLALGVSGTRGLGRNISHTQETSNSTSRRLYKSTSRLRL